MRDGNGTRSVETLLRYRNAAIAELLRAQRLLQALQAETRAEASAPVTAAPRRRLLARPNEPTKARQINGSTENRSVKLAAARPAPLATAPTKQPTRAPTPKQRPDLRAPRRAPHNASARDPADTGPALPSPVAKTKQTREGTSNREIGPRAPA